MIELFSALLDSADSLGIPDQKFTQSSLDSILNLVYMIAAIIAVIMVVIGGMGFVNSGGNPEKVKSAKNTVLYAVIGLIVVALAFVITNFIIGKVE